MKAKLIKLEDGKYDLLVESNLEELKNTKLSLKNCQAIERGYDLDELAREEILYNDQKREWWKAGFQKALELMGDKKFSEDDVRLMLIDMARFIATKELRDDWDLDVDAFFRKRDFFIDKQIQSLQQTEWDVTFNPDELDADGCLILKIIRYESK